MSVVQITFKLHVSFQKILYCTMNIKTEARNVIFSSEMSPFALLRAFIM